MDSTPFSSTFVNFPRSSTPPDADTEVSISVIEVAGDAAGDNNAQYTHTIAPTPHSPGLLSPTNWHQDRPHHVNFIHPRSAPPTPQVGFNTMYHMRQSFSRSEENLVLSQDYTLSALNSPSPGAESEYSFTSDQVDGHPPHSPISDTSSIPQPAFSFPANAGSDSPPSSRSDGQNASDGLHLSPHASPQRNFFTAPGRLATLQRRLHTVSDSRTLNRLHQFSPSPSPTHLRTALPPDDCLGSSTNNGTRLYLTDPLDDPCINVPEDPLFGGYSSDISFDRIPPLYNMPTSGSSSSSFLASPASASNANAFFNPNMSTSCTLGNTPVLQLGAHDQSGNLLGDFQLDNDNWMQGMEQASLIESQQASSSSQLNPVPYQAAPTTSSAANALATHLAGRNFSAGSASVQQAGSVNTFIPVSVEDGASEEMKEQMVDLLADSRSRTEAVQKIHALGVEKRSSAPDELLLKAAGRKVGTDEVRNAAHKRKLKSAAFKCVLCPYELTAKDNLKNHYRSHLDYKPCRCTMDSCGMGFGNPSGLKRHMEKKHHFRQPLKRGATRSKSVHRPES
ncbi:unnamed protein product [Cyclocybe aegerita]|uniref:C2H2-type domain-containing protein n=1 Tax=Cyclocybe aegerita TaxID=1973307 RepID=A0A8S0WXE1_CYCAE|nr:unnamed protein product [Cyclocybe aegerita]